MRHSHRLDISELESSGEFHRDSNLGGIFHHGKVSFRERAAKDGLHVSLGEGNRVSVHVDRWSPLATRRSGARSAYSVVRVVGHNVGIVVDAVLLVVRRSWGHQRCELECETVCDDDCEAELATDLVVTDVVVTDVVITDVVTTAAEVPPAGATPGAPA